MELYILGAGVFVFVAHLLDGVFKRFRVPDILCLMVLGVLVGPAALGWLAPKDFGQVGAFMGALALVVILFEGGLSLKARTLLSTAKRSVPFAFLSFALTVTVLSFVCWALLDLRPWLAILGGFIMGGTSSAVVIPVVRALACSEETTTLLTVESAITDVLCIVGAVGIMLALTQPSGEVETQELAFKALASLVMAAGFGTAAGFLWVILLSRVQNMEKSLLMTLAYALVIYGLTEWVGVSGAIAALCLGIVMGNVRGGFSLRIEMGQSPTGAREAKDPAITLSTGELTGAERKVYAEVVFLLKAFFFFHLGLTVRPQDFLSVAGLVALMLAMIPILPRYPIVRLLFPRRLPRREVSLAVALMPRGLAAAVLAQLAASQGIEGGEALASLVAMMVFLSISFVAVLVFCVERGLFDIASASLFRPFRDGPIPHEGPTAAPVPDDDHATEPLDRHALVAEAEKIKVESE